MTTPRKALVLHRSPLLLITAIVAILALPACSTTASDRPTASTSPPSDAGHGSVRGASEMSEPQLGLAVIDSRGEVSHLDLLDESTTSLGTVPAPDTLTSDGRYLFSSDGDGLTVLDSGRWTWDHVDHFHYYLAEPQNLGRVEGRGEAHVATTNSSTSGGTGVHFAESGDAVLLDTHALSGGKIVEHFRLSTPPHAGLVVPLGDFALVTSPVDGVAASVVVVDNEGKRVSGSETECAGAQGTITTRVGAVIGCDDGALLATLVDGTVELARIPYPEGTSAPRAQEFSSREGRPVVAALAGDAGIWLLDTRERSWTLLPAPTPLVAVTAVADEAHHVLALSAEGRVLVIDGTTASVIAETEPLAQNTIATGTPEPLLLTDQHRAYLSAPAEGAIFEIDFADAARIARTFTIDAGASLVAGTGR